MRDLYEFELEAVSGAGSSPAGPCSCYCPPAQPSKKQKGNNGFGNGGNDPAPGNSGRNGSPNAAQKQADQVR